LGTKRNEWRRNTWLGKDQDDTYNDITFDDSETDYDETATTTDDDNDGDDNNNDDGKDNVDDYDDDDFMQQGHGGKKVTYNVKGQFVYIEDFVRYSYETSTTNSF
jgi:hypothetical protein